MPVYPFPGRSASSCTSPGCLCRDRRPAYPSDTTDEQWRVLRPEAETVMAGLVLAAGRPMVHDLRAMLDAVFYVARNGVEWRALPADFPPHAAVYKFFERWSQRELPETLVHRLRRRLRVHQGRDGEPTAGIVDSQIVKAADTVGKDSRGFHGGKKINGRGRHAAVDAEGWLLSVVVTGAQVSDRAGAKLLAISLLNALTTLKIMWADSGYDGKPLAIWMKQAAGLTLQIIKRSDKPGFQVVSRRWVVERTFGWLLRYRRLGRDYERRPAHHEAMVYWATIMIMTRRLARYETGIAPVRRWGGDRSHPSPKQDQQVPGPLTGQVGPQPGVIPQLPDLGRRDETGPQHPPLGQLRQPHRIELVRLRASRGVLHIPGVHQLHVQPGRLQQVEPDSPVIAGRLQGDHLDPLARQLLPQLQDRAGRRGHLPDHGAPLPRPGRVRHPGAHHARSLRHVDRGDPLQDLLVLLVLDLLRLQHLRALFLASPPSGHTRGCPGASVGNRNSDRRARSNNARPIGQGPSARLACGLTSQRGTGVSGQPPRSCPPRSPSTGKPRNSPTAASARPRPADNSNRPAFSRPARHPRRGHQDLHAMRIR